MHLPKLFLHLYKFLIGSTDVVNDEIDVYNRSFTPTLSSSVDPINLSSFTDPNDGKQTDFDMLTVTTQYVDKVTVTPPYVDQVTPATQYTDHDVAVTSADSPPQTAISVNEETTTSVTIQAENLSSQLSTSANEEFAGDIQLSTPHQPITREELLANSTTTDVISQISEYTHTSTLSTSRLTTTQDMMSHISDISRVNTGIQSYNTVSTLQVNSDTVTANNGSDTTDHMTEGTASDDTLQDYHTKHGNYAGETTTIQNLDGTSIDLNRNNSLSVVSISNVTTESWMDMTQQDNYSKNTSQHTAPPDAVPITSEFSTFARIVSHVTSSAMLNAITDDNDVTPDPFRMTSDPEKGGAITEEGGASSVMESCKLLAR